MSKPPFDPSSRDFPYFMTYMRGRRGRCRAGNQVGIFESLFTMGIAVVFIALAVLFELATFFH